MDRTKTAALAAEAESSKGDTIATLHSFAQDLAAHLDLNDLLRNALLAAARLTGAQHGTALLIDEQSEQISCRVALDNGNLAPLELVARPMMRKGLAGWVARERQAVLVPDTEQDPRWLPGPGLGDLRSAIVAPLSFGTHLLGVMTLGHELPGHFVADHLHLLEVLCAPVALAVDHARLATALATNALPEQPGPRSETQRSQLPARPAPSDRPIVALSAKLRGLSAAAGRLTPEALVNNVLNAYFQAIDEIVRQHQGTVDSLAGDTLLAIFSHSEQAATDAVRSALGMRLAAQRLTAHWRAEFGIGTGSLDVGIARGVAAIGGMGVLHGVHYAVGEVVGAAERLRELARGGEILLSSTVAAELEAGVFSIEALQPLRLLEGAPQQIFRISTRQ
jgi:class 3 adenylate cyclase